jgi:hypothetical protein
MLSTNILRWIPSGEHFVQLKIYLRNELGIQISRGQALYSSLSAVVPSLKLNFNYLISKMMQFVEYAAFVVAALPHVLSTPSVLQPTPPMGEFIP